MSKFDNWLTRQPEDEEVPTPHCQECGVELPETPMTAEWREDKNHCSGKLITVTEEYSDHAVDLLGEEFRGKTYSFEYTECGQFEGEHPEHDDVVNAYQVLTWTCPEGHVTTITVQ